MKRLVFLLFTLLSFSVAYSQPGSLSQSVYRSRVNDSTTVVGSTAAGYSYFFWNNQATIPHWDFWNGSTLQHIFSFGSGGGGGGTNYWKTDGNTTVTENIVIDGSSAGKAIEMYFDSFVMSTATSGFGFDAAGADFTGDTGYVRIRSENGANDVLIETTPTNITLDTDVNMTWRIIDNLIINTVTPTTGMVIGNTNGTPLWETLTSSSVGLANVDNTSDANKPVSTATQTALNLKTDLATTIVSVTGAITLTSTAYDKIHVCTGTTVDYTVDLPTAVGNTGKRIAFKGSSALTKNVTLDGNSTETIDGETTRAFTANGVFVVLSDGTNWHVVHEVGSWVTYTPTWTGFSSLPTVISSKYFRQGKMCTVKIVSSVNGTSDATTTTVTVPFNASAVIQFGLMSSHANNNVVATTPGSIITRASSNIIDLYINTASAAWTASNGKRMSFTLIYELL